MVDRIWNFNLILENMFFSQCENSYDGGSIFIQSWSYKCYVSYLGIDPIFLKRTLKKVGCYWLGQIIGTLKYWPGSRVNLTLWGKGASLALVDHPDSDGVTIKISYGVDVLVHQAASYPIFSYWVGSNWIWSIRSIMTDLGRWALVVAVISVDTYPFWLSQTWPVTLRIQE